MVGSAVEAELLEIRQKVKVLESNKAKSASRNEEAARLIATQRAQIEKLKHENKQLQQDLSVDVKGGVSASIMHQDRIFKLQEVEDTYTRKIEMEGRQLESIQQELELTQVKVHELRKNMGGSQAPDDNQRQAAKHRLVLENRLEQAERRFCESLAKNREMREEIESMNKQREAFELVQMKLERELAAKRGEVSSLRQLAAVASEARGVALSQLESLKTQSDKEQSLFEAEAAELSRCLSGDQQLLAVQARRLGRQLEASEVLGSGVEEGEEGPSFKEALEQLAQAAGVEAQQLPALVSHYSTLEALNFQVFGECNAANEQIAAMQKKIRSMENEARQAEVEGVLGKQKEVIRQTLTKRDQMLRRAEVLDEKRQAMERRLLAIQAGASQVLRALGCAPAAAPDAAAAAAPAALSSSDRLSAAQQRLAGVQQQAGVLTQSLGQLEARARAVMAVWSTVMGKTASVPGAQAMVHAQLSSSMSRQAAAALAAPAAAAAAAPSTKYGNKLYDESESDSDGDEAPLTRDQIQESMLGGQRR